MSTEVDPRILGEVLAHYGLVGTPRRVSTGLINATYMVEDGDGTGVAVVQRLHPVFEPEVNIDLDAVTGHLAELGMVTPRLLRTTSGERWCVVGGERWRALSAIRGETFERIERPAQAESAGALVGQFHRAVSTLEHDYVFVRAGVHDTTAHLAKLDRLVGGGGDDDDGCNLGRMILAQAQALPPMAGLPLRHTHGDLKISNVLFDPENHDRALCLIDLDTTGLQTMAYELGDMLRSWCNPRGEDEGSASFDMGIFEAAMTGYVRGASGLLSAAELRSIVVGVETVCVELAARFCCDVFEDCYFGWNANRFDSRRAHNLVRARGQLALARSAAACREPATAILLGLAEQ